VSPPFPLKSTPYRDRPKVLAFKAQEEHSMPYGTYTRKGVPAGTAKPKNKAFDLAEAPVTKPKPKQNPKANPSGRGARSIDDTLTRKA